MNRFLGYRPKVDPFSGSSLSGAMERGAHGPANTSNGVDASTRLNSVVADCGSVEVAVNAVTL